MITRYAKSSSFDIFGKLIKFINETDFLTKLKSLFLQDKYFTF